MTALWTAADHGPATGRPAAGLCAECDTAFVVEDDEQPTDLCDDCADYDPTPCCADPSCSGSPCTFPGYAATH